MKEEELKQRIVDRVDILADPVDDKVYKEEEVSVTTVKITQGKLDLPNDMFDWGLDLTLEKW